MVPQICNKNVRNKTLNLKYYNNFVITKKQLAFSFILRIFISVIFHDERDTIGIPNKKYTDLRTSSQTQLWKKFCPRSCLGYLSWILP